MEQRQDYLETQINNLGLILNNSQSNPNWPNGRGAPIAYSWKLRTYYYEHAFSISIFVKMKNLEDSEICRISAGQEFFPTFSPTAFFVQ